MLGIEGDIELMPVKALVNYESRTHVAAQHTSHAGKGGRRIRHDPRSVGIPCLPVPRRPACHASGRMQLEMACASVLHGLYLSAPWWMQAS
jgi:hypothetical protein